MTTGGEMTTFNYLLSLGGVFFGGGDKHKTGTAGNVNLPHCLFCATSV